IEKEHRNQVFFEFQQEEHIHLIGGHDNSSAFFAVGYGDGRVESFGPEEVHYFPYEAKITFSGAKYLKDELEIREKEIYNINIFNSTISNSNLASPSASIAVTNEIIKKIDDLIDTLKKTENI